MKINTGILILARQLLTPFKNFFTMKSTCIASIFFLCASYASAQSLKDAISKTENERFSAASAEFKALVEKEPTGVNYFYFGENYYEWGEIDSALITWKKGAALDASSPMGMVTNGKVQWVEKNYAGAKASFNQALTTTKNKNAEVMRAIAKAYLDEENKNIEGAITLLQSATKLEPANEDGHLLLGDALLEKTPDNGTEAIKSYKQVLSINPKSPRGYVRTGNLYQRARNFELANENYEEAKKLDPTYAPAYRENAELHMRFSNNKQAIENWRKYLELNNSQEARYRFATAMFNGKQYCEVIPEIEALQASQFNNFYMERMLTYSCLECTTDKSFISKGLLASDRFFNLVPEEKIIYLDYKYKGLLLSKDGKDSLAAVALEKASEINEEASKELAGDLAKLYAKMSKFDKVISKLEFKAQFGKLSAKENNDLGLAYFKGLKDFTKADEAFAKVVDSDSSYYPAHYYRARCALTFDPTKEKWLAQPHYEKAFQCIKPEDRTKNNANKAMVMEASKYLGDFYATSASKDLKRARDYWTVVKELDPNDKQAAAFFKANP
jgi:tetratricopeptide (TPR) repeat protein